MTEILDTPLSNAMAWKSETLLPNDGKIILGPDCLNELFEIGNQLRSNPLPTEAIRPEFFNIPACEDLMTTVRSQINQGIGFAVIDRIPLESFETDIAIKMYWILMNLVGQAVAQKWDGTLIYDVTDTQQKEDAGNGVRSSKTNSGQAFHTDNSFNVPPEYVALFCIQTAKEGGISGLVSLETVYNDLLQNHKEIIPRLYQPFHYDRQREHADDESLTSLKPMAEYDGSKLEFNFSPRLIDQGYKVVGEEMDSETKSAISTLVQVTEKKNYCKSFEFEVGQIQIVNNRRLGHRRTAYTDTPENPRRLVRLWIRNQGRPFYAG